MRIYVIKSEIYSVLTGSEQITPLSELILYNRPVNVYVFKALDKVALGTVVYCDDDVGVIALYVRACSAPASYVEAFQVWA